MCVGVYYTRAPSWPCLSSTLNGAAPAWGSIQPIFSPTLASDPRFGLGISRWS
jgi:hypothetical protein